MSYNEICRQKSHKYRNDNDVVKNCRFSVASKQFDNEVLIDFRRKSCEKSYREKSIQIQSRRCFASGFFVLPIGLFFGWHWCFTCNLTEVWLRKSVDGSRATCKTYDKLRRLWRITGRRRSRMLKESLKYFNIIQAKQLLNSHLCYIISQCTEMSKTCKF